MPKLRMLVVSKDNGDTKMLLPIARESMRVGHEVNILAEGVGVAHYSAAGIVPFFTDAPNPDPKSSFNWDALFRYLNPQVVLIGFPGPDNLSHTAGLAANQKGIPVVGVEDYWGGVERNPEVKYNLVLTIDDYAKQIARQSVGPRVPISIIGNHAIPGADYHSPDSVAEGMKKIRERFDEVFIFGGGGELHTTAELKLLVASLEKTPGNWCLIPRYHPNVKKKTATAIGDSRTFEEVWNKMLLPLGDRVVRLDVGNSDDMAMLCDGYFSGLGSSMSTAIASGKPTVAVLTDATVLALRRESKLDTVPAVYLGGAQVLSKVGNVRPLLIKPSKAIQQKLQPLNPALAIQEIEDMLLF
ncbi:MAG: hypothetical protein Q8P76_02870 [bacterium]|nr:hypothetical protein [bacterium]